MRAQGIVWEGPFPVTTIADQIKMALLSSHAHQASQEALSAEAIRVALWVQSAYKQVSSSSDVAVTTRHLLNQARALWTPIRNAYQYSLATNKTKRSDTHESEGESVIGINLDRDVLDALAEQGDFYSLGEGRWLPAPLRLVPLSQTRYLLVGGMPTHLLPGTLLHNLHLHGSFRHVDSSALPAMKPDAGHTVQWQFQSLGSWLGASPLSLDDLAQSFNKQELLPVTHHSDADPSLEAYAAYVGGPQLLRWRPLDDVTDGHYLLRTSTPWGIRQYSSGHISNHWLIKQSVLLQHIDIRRLCYALDKQAGKPTRASWNAQRDELSLNSELPERERKLLSSIVLLQENEGSYYPRRWVNIRQHINTIFPLLTNLGINIVAVH